MAIITIFDIPTMNSEQYERVINELEEAGVGNPDGRRYHIAATKDGGRLIVDVWETEEQLNKFSETLIPILQGAGVTPAEPQIYPVNNTISG